MWKQIGLGFLAGAAVALGACADTVGASDEERMLLSLSVEELHDVCAAANDGTWEHSTDDVEFEYCLEDATRATAEGAADADLLGSGQSDRLFDMCQAELQACLEGSFMIEPSCRFTEGVGSTCRATVADVAACSRAVAARSRQFVQESSCENAAAALASGTSPVPEARWMRPDSIPAGCDRLRALCPEALREE